jgi:hypothetical protein
LIIKLGKLRNIHWIEIKANSCVDAQNNIFAKVAFFRFLIPVAPTNLVMIGTLYGGYPVPKALLESNSSKLCISVGLGDDISFDKGLVGYGFDVIGIEPLHKWNYLYENLAKSGKFSYLNAFAVDKIQSDNELTIKSLYLNTYEVKILKIDIEGKEIDLMQQVLHDKLIFDLISLELDSIKLLPFFAFVQRFKGFLQVRSFLKDMQKANYQLIHAKDLVVTFSREG